MGARCSWVCVFVGVSGRVEAGYFFLLADCFSVDRAGLFLVGYL